MGIRERIAEIKSRIDILDVVSAVLSLKKAGRQWVALCPFHPDTKPSFYVSSDRQSYRCFGCGAAGDVISFVMNHRHLSFKEAVTELARQAGVEVRWRSDERRSRYSLLYELNETVAKYYRDALYSPAGKEALEYITARGFERDTLERFRIGYAPSDWGIVDFLLKKGFERDDIIRTGVCMDYEGRVLPFLRNRVVFPITDASGRVVGFGGRALSEEGQPKYLNTRETPIFKKSTCLYGIYEAKDEARRKGEILVTEGYTDVLMAHQRSVRNVCAVLGTAFTQQHSLLMKRYAQRAILLFDADTAGRKAATRSVDILLSAELDVRIARLPESNDLCDYIATHSPEELDEILQEARSFIEFLYGVCVKEYGDDVRGRKQTIHRIAEALSHIKSESERHLWAKEVAELMGVQPHIVLSGAKPQKRKGRTEGAYQPELHPRDCDIIEMMLLDPSMVEEVARYFSPDDIEDEKLRRVASHIFEQNAEFGTFDLEGLYATEGGESIRKRVKEVLARAERLSADDKRRDYRTILDGWVKRKRKEERKRELWEAIRSDDVGALDEFCREAALKDGVLGEGEGERGE